MQPRSSTVQATLVLELLDSEGDMNPVQAELRYDSGDPFAVRGDFCLDEQVVRWVFARSLLRTGLYEPTGSGDVRVRPWLDTDGGAVVHIELSSPDGAAVLQARAATSRSSCAAPRAWCLPAARATTSTSTRR